MKNITDLFVFDKNNFTDNRQTPIYTPAHAPVDPYPVVGGTLHKKIIIIFVQIKNLKP